MLDTAALGTLSEFLVGGGEGAGFLQLHQLRELQQSTGCQLFLLLSCLSEQQAN